MKTFNFRRSVVFNSSILILAIVFNGCAINQQQDQALEGTKVVSNRDSFKRFASDLSGDCARIGGCACYVDGLQTSCSFVFSCLRFGWCRQLAN